METTRYRAVRRRLIGLAPLASAGALLLASCNNNPYALSVNEINEDGPQRPAAILLSDPQIYARETLLNDRRREVQYLKKLVDQSETAVFEPQLKRALQSARALSGQLSATVDPLAGAQASRTAELDRLQQQIDANDKQIQMVEQERRLVDARKRLQLAQQSDTPSADAQTTVTVDQTKVDALTQQVTSLQKDMADLKKQLAATPPEDLKSRLPDTSQFRSADVTSTPQELFHDRQAYREELRSAQAAAELDDSHDYYGNGLYRLQFAATVAPGRDKDKYAVARLTVEPPDFGNPGVIEGIYKLWLSHVAYRLNGVTGGSLRADFDYQVLGVDSNFYHYVDYPLPSGHPLRIVVPPKLFNAAADLLQSSAMVANNTERLQEVVTDYQSLAPALDIQARGYGRELQNYDAQVKEQEARVKSLQDVLAQAHAEKDERKAQQLDRTLTEAVATLKLQIAQRQRAQENYDQTTASQKSLAAKFELTANCEIANPDAARLPIGSQRLHGISVDYAVQHGAGPGGELVDVLTYIAASLRGMGDRPDFTDSRDQTEIDKLLRLITDFENALLRFHALFPRDAAVQKACETRTREGIVPDHFSDFVRNTAKEPGRGAFAYATTPVELAQHVSTIASAISSLELGLAVSAQLQQYAGLTADASLKYLSAAQGKVDALERLPLVVGFSDRKTAPDASGGGQEAQFGWIFGPRAVVDPKNQELLLRQVVQNYPVTADLSVPSWWPYVKLRLETGWIANWYGDKGGNPILQSDPQNGAKLTETRVFTRPLPHNRADLDGLTEALAYKTMGGTLATTRIVRVEPDEVSLCDTSVTFLIYGANVWRGTAAYLNGVAATTIDVLPDMAGLATTFDVRNLPRLKKEGDAKLVIWTRNGAADKVITVRSGTGCVGQSAGAAPRGQAAVPRLIGDSKEIRVTVTPPLSAFNGLALQLRPHTAAGAVPQAWTPFAAANTQFAEDGSTLMLTLQAAPNTVVKYKDGTALEAQLAVTLRPDGAAAPVPVAPVLVYYSAADKAKATAAAAAGGDTLGDLGDAIVVRLPPMAKNAYAGFDPATTPITASVAGAPEFALAPAQRRLDADGKISLRLKLAQGDNDALRKTARNISLKFEGSDAPPLCDACLKLPAAK